ncbi:hypothetical protein HMSSN036_61810 [Paenibacillus macerans]|nr:hypothetical protein HMSSN036_61810 [Paenibacillus macerans]
MFTAYLTRLAQTLGLHKLVDQLTSQENNIRKCDVLVFDGYILKLNESFEGV